MKKVFLKNFLLMVNSGLNDRFSLDVVISYKPTGYQAVYHDIRTLEYINNDLVIGTLFYSVRFTAPQALLLQSDTNSHIDTYKYSNHDFEVAFLLEDIRED